MVFNIERWNLQRKCFFVCLLLLGFLSFITSIHASNSIQLSDEEMKVVKDRLLTWSESLKSFSGEYTVDQYWPQEPERTPLHFDFIYRVQGENRLLTHEFTDATNGIVVTHTDALLNGQFSDLHSENNQVRPIISGSLEYKSNNWTFPPSALISPEKLFGNLEGEESLADFLSVGETTLHERDGRRLLHHHNNGYALLICFDQQNHVARYELGYSSLSLEEVSAYWDGEPIDFSQLILTLELKNYAEINGVSFPSRAVKTCWGFEDAPFEALRARYEAEKWEPIIFHVKACTELDVVPRLVQHFELDVNTAQVNADLPDSMFKIDYPEETVLFSASGERIQPGPGLWFWVLLVGGGIVLLLLLGGGGWYWCYVR